MDVNDCDSMMGEENLSIMDPSKRPRLHPANQVSYERKNGTIHAQAWRWSCVE